MSQWVFPIKLDSKLLNNQSTKTQIILFDLHYLGLCARFNVITSTFYFLRDCRNTFSKLKGTECIVLMVQPEAVYLSFIKLYSITDQSSNDNLMFCKVIYCWIKLPTFVLWPLAQHVIGSIFKGQETSRSPLFLSGSSSNSNSRE